MKHRIPLQLNVLMSTFNGEKYLAEQIDSILSQRCPKNIRIIIYVRDDGSTDNTLNILKKYVKTGRLYYKQGVHIGLEKSFWNLIKSAPHSDYYALSDQDDVWFENKLQTAILALEEKKESLSPLLYFSRTKITDEKLNILNVSKEDLRHSYTDFAHSLIYNTTSGCTFVFNNLAREILCKYDMSNSRVFIHDWLIHKIISMFGQVILDETPCLFYRQHENNAIGFQKSPKLFKRILNFIKFDCKHSKSAADLLEIYGPFLNQDKRILLDAVANYKNNFRSLYNLLVLPDFRVPSLYQQIKFYLHVLFFRV